MHYYFAPMEGLTDSTQRKIHHRYFPGVDRYYMPFLSPTMHRTLTHREERELPLADSVSFTAIPQILTKIPEDFLWAAQVCADRGYREVNLNIGCPSGTVVSKGKGAGMLADPAALDRFFDSIFTSSPVPISVKTRLGISDPGEFPTLVEIFNRYPICELTLHPRVRKAFYNGDVHIDSFRYLVQNSKNPVCYNGNLCSVEDIDAFRQEFPQVEAVMIGRGLIGDPAMLTSGRADAAILEQYHDTLLEEYLTTFGGGRNAMFRMKEHWHHLRFRFEGSEKHWKRLRKTTDLQEFRSITAEIFQTLPLLPKLQPDW